MCGFHDHIHIGILYLHSHMYFIFNFFQVNNKAAGKTALHCASVSGNVDMVKLVLEFSPDLEVAVSEKYLILFGMFNCFIVSFSTVHLHKCYFFQSLIPLLYYSFKCSWIIHSIFHFALCSFFFLSCIQIAHYVIQYHISQTIHL